MLIPVDFGRGAVVKGDPGASDVHVDAIMGAGAGTGAKPKKKKTKLIVDVDGTVITPAKKSRLSRLLPIDFDA